MYIYIYIHMYLHPEKRDRIGGIIQPAKKDLQGPLGIIWFSIFGQQLPSYSRYLPYIIVNYPNIMGILFTLW